MTAIAALASGLLLWASFPPLNFGPLAWVALVPLLAVLWQPTPPSTTLSPNRLPWRRRLDPRTALGAGLHGYLAGAVFFLLNLKWLHHVTAFGAVMLCLYLALYPAVWAVFAATAGRPRRWDSPLELARATAATAAAWTGLEWLRGLVLTGFGWNGLGVALATSSFDRHVRQWAEWIGVTGLSFFVVTATATAVALWHRQPSTPGRLNTPLAKGLTLALALASIHLALTLVGHQRSRPLAAAVAQAQPLTVALVQPNIPQATKNLAETFDQTALVLTRLTQDAFASTPAPELVVWPESSLPAPYYYEGVQEVLRQNHRPGPFTHILGIDDQELDAYYNSIAVFRGDPVNATLHHKVHLVPFGEYLPARGLFGRFDFIREQLPGDFAPGRHTAPLPLPLPPGASPPELTLIPLVCFEDTLGRVARRFVRPHPQIIVNVTNDAWFKHSEGADQHLANAVFRAIELRKPMVRAANTGVTAAIDPLGRITSRLPNFQEGVLKTSIPLPTTGPLTVYARCGDLFAQTLLAAALLAAATHAARPRPA